MLLSDFVKQIPVKDGEFIGSFLPESLIFDAADVASDVHIEPTTVYYGALSKAVEWNYFAEEHEGAVLLLYKDSDYKFKESFISCNFVILIETMERFVVIKQMLLELLAEKMDVISDIVNFSSQMLKCSSLQSLVDTAANQLQVPLVVSPPGGRTQLACSRNMLNRDDDPLWKWDDLKAKGVYSVEQKTRDIYYKEKETFYDNKPVTIYYSDVKRWRVSSRVINRNQYVASIYTAELNREEISKFNMVCFQMLTVLVGHYLEFGNLIYMGRFNRDGSIENILGDLLDDVSIDLSDVETKGKNPLPYSRMQIINLSVYRYDFKDKPYGYLMEKLTTMFPNSIKFYFKRDVILLLNLDKDKNKFVESAGEFETLALDNNITITISDPISSIRNLRSAYDQTVRTFEIIHQLGFTGNIYYYNDFKTYDLIISLKERNPEIELEQYCDVTLKEIRQYDKDTQSEFYETLKQYVLMNRSLTKVANHMFLHKGTISYRINKLKDLFGLDVSDSNRLMSFYSSFLLFDLIDKEDSVRKP